MTKFDSDVIVFKVFSSTSKRKAGVFKLLQFKERFRFEGINTVFMSVQVVKAVQTFEVTRYFILLSVVQGACSRIAVYVSKCVDQEEFCDGRTWMTCHVDPYCHTTYPRSQGCCSSGSVEKQRPWERVWTQRCLGCVPFNQVKSGFITKPILVCNQTIRVRRWIVQIGNQLFDPD